jgi:hypothetical protein
MLISPSTKIAQFMLNSKRVLFYAYQRVECLSVGRLAAFNAYQCGKKLKSIYLETTFFSATVCPTRVLCSRQIQ